MDLLVQIINLKYCLVILHRENLSATARVHNNNSIILREQHVNCDLLPHGGSKII